jgi:hypothetical protein
MNVFSHEHLDKLQDELKLINMTLGRLSKDMYFNRTYGAQPTSQAVQNLMIRRIEVEAMIETLNDHLNG